MEYLALPMQQKQYYIGLEVLSVHIPIFFFMCFQNIWHVEHTSGSPLSTPNKFELDPTTDSQKTTLIVIHLHCWEILLIFLPRGGGDSSKLNIVL
jgi:hypothetical protein